MTAAAWLLCVFLDRSQPDPVRVCIREETETACYEALRDWLTRAWDWERRSHSQQNPRVVAACRPIEEEKR
jgi:hypothetical protein